MTLPAEPVNALVWAGGSNFEFVALPLPLLGEGESLVRLTTSTLCGSDRHTVSGRRSQPCPSILGHEGVGIVQDTRNPDLVVGQRVTFSVIAPCLQCDRCMSGRTAKCREVLKTGHEPIHGKWPLSGTYSTHILLRKNQLVVDVPDALADAPASVSACAGATVMAVREAACTSAQTFENKRVVVMGVGMLGLIAVEAAVRDGAASVIAVDLSEERLRWARDVGATETLTPDEYATTALPESVDISLEFSGTPAGVKACLAPLDIGGTAVLAGSVADSPNTQINPEWLVRGWRTVTGVHNYEPRHLQQAVDFLASSSIPWDEVIGEPIALSDVPGAFSTPPNETMRTAIRIDS
ncbi:zinc-binding dehydrogenase [Corynebacterium sp. H78]|uniref:zinc-binding dehydrogenase n=1 Tax=Corynebacterium sp. H78 TaxID=3133417 RepID=UPI0030B1EBD5